MMVFKFQKQFKNESHNFNIITNFCNYDDIEAINNRKRSEKFGKNRKRSESVVMPDLLYETLSINNRNKSLNR